MVLFLPLYAAWSPGRRGETRGAGVGTFTDLGTLARWAEETAGALTGTLPLFPAFLDKPFDPSPYAPVTRLFWGEQWIDPAAAPEYRSPQARHVLASRELRASDRRARLSSLVSYRAVWKAKRLLLGAMSDAAYQDPARRRALERFERSDPIVTEYAEFRAAMDLAATTLNHAPAASRTPTPVAYDDADRRLYVYAQMLAEEQMALAAGTGDKRRLYLDLPVGVHTAGFDTWRYPELFLRGVSAGAPPDALHERGQVWSFPPMHPWAGRRDGWSYLRRVLRRMFSAARIVRIDHVMGLHRMYCVPPGFAPDEGAYLRYPAEELYSMVRSEAARADGMVVGEDLGTVPGEVREAMRRAGFLGMHVQQFEFDGSGQGPVIRGPGSHQLACLNTHDTPTFAGFWTGNDIRLRARLGRLAARGAQRELAGRGKLVARLSEELSRDRRRRSRSSLAAAQACRSLSMLHAESDAPIQLVNLEDLWGEPRPQNVPGTIAEYPNWRRRARRSLPQITHDRRISGGLRELAELRNQRLLRSSHRQGGR
jgi:4-alpha-glucanotransferase